MLLLGTMQPHEALDVAAQVAVTLAGFAGIVVVFRPSAVHKWPELDRLRLRLLLANSAMPLCFSLFGILLLSIEPAPPGLWRWCSGIMFVAQLIFGLQTAGTNRKVSRRPGPSINRLLYTSMAALGSVGIVLQLVNVAWLGKFWPFFASIVIHLVAAIAQFIRMIVLPPEASEENAEQ